MNQTLQYFLLHTLLILSVVVSITNAQQHQYDNRVKLWKKVNNDNDGHDILTHSCHHTPSFWTPQRIADAKEVKLSEEMMQKIRSFAKVSDIPSESNIEFKHDEVLFDPPTEPTIASTTKHTKRQIEANFPPGTFAVPFENYLYSPYTAVGRVFWEQDNNTFVCSGSANGKNIVLTAGHCVIDPKGKPHNNWIFVPEFTNDTFRIDDHKHWEADHAYYMGDWYYYGSFQRDVAYYVMKPKDGKVLSDKVKTLGMLANYARNAWFLSCGYPMNAPFTGNRMIATYQPGQKTDNKYHPPTTGIVSAMHGGVSGGPWIAKAVLCNTTSSCPPDATNYNYANGVNSYHYPSGVDVNIQWSPYFDTLVWNMRQEALKASP